MAVSGKLVENSIPVGNYENKYASTNPIAKFLMSNFIGAVKSLALLRKDEIGSINEIGCGEGFVTHEIRGLGITDRIKGCDFSSTIIDVAKQQHPDMHFYVKSIYDIKPEQDGADLVICCEVLEHLELPGAALEKLRACTGKYCILSVPNEPLWRVLNMARGKYLDAWGNTPGHINHWSSGAFRKLVSPYFTVLETRRVLPWTILFCRK